MRSPKKKVHVRCGSNCCEKQSPELLLCKRRRAAVREKLFVKGSRWQRLPQPSDNGSLPQ